MLKVKDIRINHLREPAGVIGTVTVGWKILSDRSDVVQTAREIAIVRDGGAEELYHEKTESGESVNIAVGGLSLRSLETCTVRVRVWDNHGEASEWASTGFITALQSDGEWKGAFITAEKPEDRGKAPGTMLRKAFTIEKEVKEAWLLSTAQGLYQAFINGKRVGQDELAPGWTSYHTHLLYQTHEVTDILKKGENAIGVLLGAGWYKGDITWFRRHNYYGSYAAFSGQLVIRYTDGSEEILASDTSWQGCRSPIIHADIYDGETYDARLEQDGWCEPGFLGSGWEPVRVAGQRAVEPVPQQGCTVRVKETFGAREIFRTPGGDTVIDFGQNISGWVRFTVTGGCGDEAELVFFETLDAAGNVYTENLRTAGQTVRYICRGKGRETCCPHFTFQGFRYVWVKQFPGEVRAEDFTAMVLYSDMAARGSFSCSHPLLNQLQSNIQWGMKGNFVDVPTDCPQRDERLGWTGDAQIFSYTANFLMETEEFYRKWLIDLAADQRDNGGVSNVIPDALLDHSVDYGDGESAADQYGAAGWGDAAVIVPWSLYLENGDPSIILQQYDSMKAWLDYLTVSRENGYIRTACQFGDWLALDAAEGSYHGATPEEFTASAYYAHACGLFAKMAEAVGRTEDAGEYRKRREEEIAFFRSRYCLPDGKLSVHTQTAYVLALHFDLLPGEERPAAAEELKKMLSENDGHLTTGFMGTPYIMHALSRNGCVKEAYDLLLKEDFPSWLYQVKQGATTVWEHWDGLKPDGTMWSADMNSFNHYAYGAVGQWLYERCAGLCVDENRPGYRHFTVRPCIGGGLDFAECVHESVYGQIRVHWEKREGDTVVLSVQVPPNTTAVLELERAGAILENGGLNFARSVGAGRSGMQEDGNTYRAETGSGNWSVAYRLIG